jgi:hypothetical protein
MQWKMLDRREQFIVLSKISITILILKLLRHIPLDELYTKDELDELIKEFSAAANEKNFINDVNLQALLLNMSFELNGMCC